MIIAPPVVETALKHTMLFRHGASRPGETLVACPASTPIRPRAAVEALVACLDPAVIQRPCN